MPTPEETVNAVPATPAPLIIPDKCSPPGTHMPLELVDVTLVPGAEAAMAAAALPTPLPPTAQEAAPGRLWRSYDPNGLELAAKDPSVARGQYAKLVASYHDVHQRLRSVTNATAANVWNAWAICDYHQTQTALTTHDSRVWDAWNTNGTTATSCGCNTLIDTAVWNAWNGTTARQALYRAQPTIEATEEQKARWEEERKVREAAEIRRRADYEANRPVREAAARQRDAEFAVAEEKRKAEQAVADAKAKRLLIECLSPEQRASLEAHNYFDVKLPSGAVYRINKGWAHNVKRLKRDGTAEHGTFCAHPSDTVPHYDNMLAQKFMLETDEAAFLRIANRG
jgi:hypothetical protein